MLLDCDAVQVLRSRAWNHGAWLVLFERNAVDRLGHGGIALVPLARSF